MSIEQEEKIERKLPNLSIAIKEFIEKQFPKAAETLDDGVVMPSGDRMTIDTVSKYMSNAALEVLKLAFDNAGIEAN